MTTHRPWIVTFSGVEFHLLDPSPSEVRLEDIAHALSQICRYGGHAKAFYSVAQHSVLVANAMDSDIWSSDLVRAGLLHDAAEAYVGDVVRPLKRHLGANYCDAEIAVEKVIFERFGLRWPMKDDERLLIKEYDNRALMTERRDLVAASTVGTGWVEDERNIVPFPETIIPLEPQLAKTQFLMAAERLGIR